MLPIKPIKSLSLVAQESFPLNELTDELGERLILASQNTATRSIFTINSTIKDLKRNAKKPKTDEWRKETMLLLEQLRQQNLDGIQAQFLANYISLEEQNHSANEINETGLKAIKSLYSNPSPLLGAYNLADNAKEFFAIVEKNKEKMIEFANEQNLHETLKPQRDTPKLNQ